MVNEEYDSELHLLSIVKRELEFSAEDTGFGLGKERKKARRLQLAGILQEVIERRLHVKKRELKDPTADEKIRRRERFTAIKVIMGRVQYSDIREVVASTQYGMGLILVKDSQNKHEVNGILYRNDGMSHEERRRVAEQVNELMKY